jgi:hypothetical protein
MFTENLSTLKIHKLSQAQYERELVAGNIDANALYLTPDENIDLTSLGVTATAAELNKLDGVTATTTELNYVDGVTSNIQEQLNDKAPTSHSHNIASTSASGFMSATDKSKLNGIESGANKYSLPTASSSTLGGVKTTSTVTSTSGLTACPIISGVPYYKDTKNTYSLSSFGVTATAAELNKLDGVTATTAELNYVDGVTSNIQTQLNGKANSSHTHSEYALSDHTHNEYALSDHTHNATELGITYSTTDIGEGTTLAAGTFYFVYK